MARWAMSFFVGLLALCSLSTLTEAACLTSGSDVIQMCQSGTTSGNILYIDANTTIQGNELCSCTATQSRQGQLEIYTITGSTFSSCSVRVDVFKQMSSQYSNIYSVHCLQDTGYTGSVAANTDVLYNMTGPGTIDACVMMRSSNTGSTITITCSPKIQIATTTTQAPTTPVPTTQAPTTQASTTQAPTTQAPSTQAPTTETPSTQAPTTQSPSTQAPTTQSPSTQAPTTQSPSTQGPTTQAPSTQAPTTEAPTTQGPTTQAPTTQGPITQAPTTQAPTTQAPTGSTTTLSAPTAGSTEALYDKFPDLKTLGWILGVVGLFNIILVSSIVMWFKRHTCCGRHIKQEPQAYEVYSTFQEGSDENEYQSIDISQSMSDRVYYNVPEPLANCS